MVEIAIIGSDMQEVIGTAIAIYLLSNKMYVGKWFRSYFFRKFLNAFSYAWLLITNIIIIACGFITECRFG